MCLVVSCIADLPPYGVLVIDMRRALALLQAAPPSVPSTHAENGSFTHNATPAVPAAPPTGSAS